MQYKKRLPNISLDSAWSPNVQYLLQYIMGTAVEWLIQEERICAWWLINHFPWGIIAEIGMRLQWAAMNIKDTWQVRLCYKRASSRFENGNCDHKKDSFILENTVDFIDLRRLLAGLMVSRKPLNISMVLKRTLEIFNGFWGDHHHWMFFGNLTIATNGFSMVFGIATIAFNGFRWFWTIGQMMRWFRWIAMV